jgi:hypothetical protein
MNPKVVIKKRDLHVAMPDTVPEKVPAAHIDGDALEWRGHFRVRQPNPESIGSEIAAEGSCRVLAVKLLKEELEEMRRHAQRPVISTAEGLYCDAQICLQGHVRSSEGYFERGERCTKCGSAYIDQCQYCRAPIRGRLAHFPMQPYDLPFFCHAPECGLPYPWIEDKLETARELLHDIENLSRDERDELWDLLTSVMSDPKSDWAPAKMKLIAIKLAKVSKASREVLLDFTAKVAAEVMKSKS